MCDINTAIYVPRRLQHKSQSANIMCRVDPCKHTVSIVLLTLVNPSTNKYEYLELMAPSFMPSVYCIEMLYTCIMLR